jgi:hypothetical protein
MSNKKLQTKSGKPIDTNASPSAYGWCFQVGAGITLMLDNVKEFTSLKMEGASDDIELVLDSGKVYAQAKSVTQIGDQRSASTNLTNALRLLSQDVENGDAVSLIYITNIANPFSSKIASAFQYEHSYEFSVLPDDAQAKILEKVTDTFPTDKFKLHILSFFGEGDNKFESIKAKIAEFLREAIADPSYNKRLLDSWFETFMVNASDKPGAEKKQKLFLTKKDVIYPVIALVIDSPVSENDFNEVCDYDNYTDICQQYRNTINANVCDYEFYAEVIGDFLSKRELALTRTAYKFDFVKDDWKTYEARFLAISNAQTREALIKLLLLTIITKRGKINEIKEATNL